MKFINIKNFNLLVASAVFLIIVLPVIMFLNANEEFKEHEEKIGFIILGDITIPGWNKSHYDGIKSACEEFGIKLLVRDNVKENNGECPAAIKDLADSGAGMIFLASYSYSIEAQNIIGEYPNIAFATNSAEVHAKNMTAYFARMYQARYLSGALAGMKTKSNVIGYVAAMSNTEVNRGINAFTLGVQRTNPNAKVVVMWTGSWQDEKVEAQHAERLIKEAGADVLTYHQDEDATAQVAEKYDADFIAYNAILDTKSEHYLTSVVCQWNLYYLDMIQRYLKGEINTVKNHWLGIDRGAIMLSEFSPAVSQKMIIKIDSLKQELINGYLIFEGEIYDNTGKIRCAAGEAISDDTLLEDINWLVKGVEVLE
ncbi:MAG: BMP family ABC transporter substrate-binding protein [Selenomonadaceae bacterium]|nr:BMP family ABC transporter substrate-binding protein [Selenomonadaceae bacterium]